MGKANKILTIIIFVYVFLIIIQNAYLFVKIQELTSTKEITSKATGIIQMCLNHQPFLNITCANVANQSSIYYCDVNAADEDNDTLIYDSDFLNSTDIFNITPYGIINFTPNQSHLGNYTIQIIVLDDSGCSNNLAYDTYNLSIVDVNDPPILISPIPNQSWNQDTSLSPFDLDSYFYDPDGDNLTYTYTLLTNIGVSIGSDNSVTFTPISGWYGVEYIIFYAWDPYMANASSNEIELRVIQTSTTQEPKPSDTSSSSGSGSGAFVPVCIPRWYCRPWGQCQPDNLRRRECYDLNECNNTLGKPNVTEPCEFKHTCYDGIKAPDEEDIDCGGPCPPCGNCYDNICNNNEDCTRGLIALPDCGGPCQPCIYLSGTCYDNICNNNEDCTRGLTDIPDCGGPCEECPEIEEPAEVRVINWGLISLMLILLILSAYLARKTYPFLILLAKKKKKKQYEEKLLLEAKIAESIYDSLRKIEALLGKESLQKLIEMFSIVVRRYFKHLFDLKYEFTYQELQEEIEERRLSGTFENVLTNFFNRSLELEFSGKALSEHELLAMISEFKHILTVTSEEPIDEKEKKKKKKGLSKIDRMFVEISEAEHALRKEELNTAYFKYVRLLYEFKVLAQEDKEKLHGFISRLYEEIKLAREKYEYEHN